MKGIDIIEAFGEIDDDLLLDAKCHKKTAPRWLKWASLAACLCCVTALTVLSLSRLAGSSQDQGAALAPAPTPEVPVVPPALEDSTAESTPAPTPEPTPLPTPEAVPTATPEAIQDYLELTSTQYPVTLQVPADYRDAFAVDTGLVDSMYEELFLNIPFSFKDGTAMFPTFSGLVWAISATPRDAYDWTRLDATAPDMTDQYYQVPLGSDDSYVYELLYSPLQSACNTENPAAVFSYYFSLTDGFSMLEDFISRNGLEEYPLWRNTYQETIIPPAEALLMEFEEDYINGVDRSTLRTYQSDITGLTLELPEDMLQGMAEGEGPALFSLYEPISRELLGGEGGLVWTICRYSTAEYLETYHRDTTAFSRSPLNDGTDYMLGRTGEYVYVLHFPTEARYDPSSPESTEAYQRYEAQSARILQHFLTDNGIEANPYWSLAAVRG